MATMPRSTLTARPSGTPHHTPAHPSEPFVQEEQGYHKALKPRQIQMIAIGGAIGTGLFLGAGGRLATAGPALLFVYALAGFMGFLILRALGELILHRPTSGSFVSYAREFFGEKAAYTVGWLYWVGVLCVGGLLLYEHTLVRPGDLRRLDAAFFTMNGVISVAFFAFVLADVL